MSPEEKRAYQRAWYAAHPGAKSAHGKTYYQRHLARLRAEQKAYVLKNKEACSARKRQWALKNKEKVLASNRETHRRRAAEERAYLAAWRIAKPEKYAAQKLRTKQKRETTAGRAELAARARHRLATDAQFAIASRLRSRLAGALRAKGVRPSVRALKLVGCSAQALKVHLEAQFLPGMSWENRSLWHIDHKRPCASFDLTDIQQQYACFHYTNLQPLWATDNMKKNARWVA
jgi:hypothetical protein